MWPSGWFADSSWKKSFAAETAFDKHEAALAPIFTSS